jgi:predicted RNA-binding Zn-ribbon protein involved in translation (DUF1610 family)
MISFNCQVCEQKITVDDRFAGKKGKCPKCKNVVVVPKADNKRSRNNLKTPQQGLAPETKQSAYNAAEIAERFLCFFCGKESEDASSASVPMCQVLEVHEIKGANAIRTLSILGIGAMGGLVHTEQLLYRQRQISVPRCLRCKNIHDSISIHHRKCFKIGGISGALIGFLLAVVPFIIYGGFGSVLWDILAFLIISVMGALIGMLLGFLLIGDTIYVLTSPSLPPNVKPEVDAEKHTNIKRMIDLNWTVGEMPKNTRGAQCFKLDEKKEAEIGIYDKLEPIYKL